MNYKHGGRRSALYGVWCAMKARCSNPNHDAYKDYGGRGIAVCPEWRDSFVAFQRDMGDRPYGATIERVDNDKGYQPGNCVWASRSAQGRNKRSTRRIEVDGVTRSMAEWAEISGLKLGTIWRRLETGWEVRAAVTTPPVPQRLRAWKQQGNALPHLQAAERACL